MLGLLAGIEDSTGFDMRDCEYFVGTSAGAIVSASLVAGRSPTRPAHIGTEIAQSTAAASDGLAAAAVEAARRAGAWALAASATFAPLALGLAAPGGAIMRGALLRTLPRPTRTLDELRTRVDHWGVSFDGRLRVAAVERASGRRVVFGSPGAPNVSPALAVEASCAVPWLFAPVEIGGREDVDGGVWSPTNADVAPAGRDTHVLCLNPTASLASSQGVLAVIRGVARSAVSIESLALRRRGAAVQMIAPNLESAEVMGTNYMDREPRASVLAAAYRQGLELATRPD